MSTRIVERLWSCERRVREEFGREGKGRKGKERKKKIDRLNIKISPI